MISLFIQNNVQNSLLLLLTSTSSITVQFVYRFLSFQRLQEAVHRQFVHVTHKFMWNLWHKMTFLMNFSWNSHQMNCLLMLKSCKNKLALYCSTTWILTWTFLSLHPVHWVWPGSHQSAGTCRQWSLPGPSLQSCPQPSSYGSSTLASDLSNVICAFNNANHITVQIIMQLFVLNLQQSHVLTE